MSYIFLFFALSGMMFGYIILAKKLGIIDNPNERSSHKKPTVRGGGIIFPIAVLLWGLFFDHTAWPFVIAVLLAGGIGILDDRYDLPRLPRLAVQSVAVLLVLWQVSLMTESVWFILIGFILFTGWLNTFNFMDGINGISVLYAFSVLVGVYLFNDLIPEVQLSLVYAVGLSLLVFGWFNVRKKALAFAGDVGSLSMGLILAYFVSGLILTTGRWEFILFFGVYGVDSVMTILHRIKKRENIFEAHRSHLYQYLANEMKWSHIKVSLLYSILQLAIIGGLFFLSDHFWTLYAVGILSVLCLMYIFAKRRILQVV